MAKSDERQLTERLRQFMGGFVPKELLAELDPAILDGLQPGQEVPKVIDLLVKKVVRLALDPNKTNQWAVELLFDRLEGKAVQGQPVATHGREIEDNLDRVSRAHLNSIGKRYASEKQQASEQPAECEAPDDTDRLAKKLMDLPSNKAGSAKEPGRESVVAQGAAN